MMTSLWIDQHERDHDRIDPDEITVANWLLVVPDLNELVVHDALEIIWLVQSGDEVQPIVWPMRLAHRHDQDCGRA